MTTFRHSSPCFTLSSTPPTFSPDNGSYLQEGDLRTDPGSNTLERIDSATAGDNSDHYGFTDDAATTCLSIDLVSAEGTTAKNDKRGKFKEADE